MPSTVERLTQKGLIRPPSWLADNVIYETVMGSVAYGVSVDISDFDTMGVCVPPKEMVFPHLAGRIEGFGRQHQKFVCYQKHHVLVPDDLGGRGREYDLNVYNIVHYFHLCMENNPNMVASLFTPQDCVLHCTKIGNMIRDKRRIFLHKGCWHKFKGYAYSQLHKIRTRNPEEGSKRAEIIDKFGWDVKFGYHTVRLLSEVEQILTEGDLDIRRNREQLKAIRRGEMTAEDCIAWATTKEQALERAYETSQLPYGPDEQAIKTLLFECLEEHWGSLKGCVYGESPLNAACRLMQDMQQLINHYQVELNDGER
ncbi:MAG: nucleotidyltransferase domain-containing protein [Candidatus Omnitrophota bacterium]|jgi:predicted nucleotidyltransferase